MAKSAPAKRKIGKSWCQGKTVVYLLIVCAVASSRSRENRRAASPSIDTDKSLKEVAPPEEKKKTPSILKIHQGAGVSKKSKTGRKAQLSARAKKRQESAMDRAEAIMDKKSTKIEKSKDRARVVQSRSKAWEEQNKKNQLLKEAHAKLMAEAEWQDESDGDEEMETSEEVKEPAKPNAFAEAVRAMMEAAAKDEDKKEAEEKKKEDSDEEL